MQNQTVSNTSPKAKANKKTAKAPTAAKVTAFLATRERTALSLNFHATPKGRIGDKFNARYVKNLVNGISKAETELTGKTVTAASVLNDFRQAKFAPTRLTEKRAASYRRTLSKLAGFEVSDEDVKRDISRLAQKIWLSGKF